MVEAPVPESPDMKRKGVEKRNATYPHTESSSKIIQCHPGARVSRVIHLLECTLLKDLTLSLLPSTRRALRRPAWRVG